MLFLAFVLWWTGTQRGHVSLGRWIAIGLVLTLAGLFKGPQPIGYFAVGIGLFVLASRSWGQIPGLVLAGSLCVVTLAAWYWHTYVPGDEAQWTHFMRLGAGVPLFGPVPVSLSFIAQTLPAVFLATAFLFAAGFRDNSQVPPGFVTAIACYAFAIVPIMLLWPGGSTARYFLPTVLPLCVLSGLAYDTFATRRPLLVAPALAVMLGLLAYSFVYSAVASPVLPTRFRATALDAERLAQLLGADQAPIYRTNISVGLNLFPYLPMRITTVGFSVLETMRGPAWFALTPEEADVLLAKRATALRPVATFPSAQLRLLRLDN
jgi:hypothetical protein